ncbi:MAG: hypothetical protein ABIS01_05360, partial [Ferruginibacter sp.]
QQLLSSIRERLAGFDLELHPEKTKLVYCKNYLRKGKDLYQGTNQISFQSKKYTGIIGNGSC